VLTEIDPDVLVENAPQYQRPWQPLLPQNRVGDRSEIVLTEADWTAFLKESLQDVRGTSREWVYRQYDSRVGASTARDCRDSVGIVRLKDSERGLGVVLGCRPHVMRFDARVGGVDAIAYPALELALKGFETLAVTDCLNFGNPERENVMSDFVASLEGMNSICAGLGAPIISGNVSFYNETMGKNITPTPSTGLVGLRGDVNNLPQSAFERAGQAVYLLRLPGLVIGGMAQEMRQKKVTGLGVTDAEAICAFVRMALKLSEVQGVEATRAVGKFGLAYALARMSTNGFGARIDFEALKLARGCAVDGAALFEEHLYEATLAVDSAAGGALEEVFLDLMKDWQASGLKPTLTRIGRTVAGRLEIGSLIETDTLTLIENYQQGWKLRFTDLH